MILGKITVKVEHFGGHRYFYCRPVANAANEPHPAIIGVAHVVYLEKSLLTAHLGIDDIFECYAIFDKITYPHQWEIGYTKTKATPITEEIFNQLSEIYPQENHSFRVRR